MHSIRILAAGEQISSLITLEDVLSDIDAHFIKATSAKSSYQASRKPNKRRRIKQ
jgi:hypothetical protein